MPGGEKDKTADYPVDKDGNKLKPCCACPETKRPRDECIMEKVTNKNMGLLNLMCSPPCPVHDRNNVNMCLRRARRIVEN